MFQINLFRFTVLAILLIHDCKSPLGMEFISEEQDFCNAHEECFRRGKSKNMIGYMVGKNHAELVAQCRVRSRNAWLNVHTLLHITAFTSGHWTFGEELSSFEGQLVTPSLDASRKKKGRITVILQNGEIRKTELMNETHPFACEFRQDRRVGTISRQEIFRQDKSGFGMSSGPGDFEGCFRQFGSATEIECALR